MDWKVRSVIRIYISSRGSSSKLTSASASFLYLVPRPVFVSTANIAFLLDKSRGALVSQCFLERAPNLIGWTLSGFGKLEVEIAGSAASSFV